MKPNYVYQMLDRRDNNGEVSLERPKGGLRCLIEVWFSLLFYNYFETLITGCLIEGGWPIEVHGLPHLIEV